MTWDQIINTGSTSWQLVKGQQAADLSSSGCNALPDVADWEKVSAATKTNSGRFTIDRTVGGRLAIDIEFDVFWDIGATYRGGTRSSRPAGCGSTGATWTTASTSI